MNILLSFYKNPPVIEPFYPRKVQLPKDKNFALFGPRGSGKSALIANYLQELKQNYLYIDCQDPIFILEDLQKETLQAFIEEEKITTLVLDHYFEGFLNEFPKVNQLILISNQKQKLNFPSFFLMPLDFEEFLAFNKNIANISHIFTLFTKKGSLPKIANSLNPYMSAREIFFEKFTEQEGKVLLILSLFQGKIASTHQIYQRAKEYFKISKDWLYKSIKAFEQEGILYQIPTLQKSVGKKLIIYDFVFSRYLNKYQTFIISFDALVALALIKKSIQIKALHNMLGYMKEDRELILIAPFESEEQAWLKIQKNFNFFNQINAKKVTLISVSNSFSFAVGKLSFEALPFYEWIIGL